MIGFLGIVTGIVFWATELFSAAFSRLKVKNRWTLFCFACAVLRRLLCLKYCHRFLPELLPVWLVSSCFWHVRFLGFILLRLALSLIVQVFDFSACLFFLLLWLGVYQLTFPGRYMWAGYFRETTMLLVLITILLNNKILFDLFIFK